MSTSVTRPSKLYCFNRGVWLGRRLEGNGEEANYPPAWHALPLHYLEFSHYCPLSTWHWNMASVLFVNTTVFSRTVKRTLLPWTIQEVPEPNYTFADFFTSVLRPNYHHLRTSVSPTDDTVKGMEPCNSRWSAQRDVGLACRSATTAFLYLMIPVISSFGRFWDTRSQPPVYTVYSGRRASKMPLNTESLGRCNYLQV